MAAAPDNVFVSGPDFAQLTPQQFLITPDGGTQNNLATLLATSTGGAVAATSVTASASTLPINGLAAAQGGSVTVKGGTSSTSANAGGAVAIVGGIPGATGTGGAVTITGGTPIAGVGGAITLTGGAGIGSTNAGANVNLVGGAAASTGQPGEVQVNGDSNLVFATYFFTGTPAATDQVFFLATRALRVKTMSQVHSVAAGGASTMTVIKDTGTSAPGAGTSLHQSGTFNLNATANTVQNGTVVTTIATANLAAGDRLSVKFANAIQSSAGIVVTVGMVPI